MDRAVSDVSTASEPHVVELTWVFEPPDYIEQALDLPLDGCTVSIGNGSVTARIPSASFDANEKTEQQVDDAVRRWFMGVQLTKLHPFSLRGPGMARVFPDGRRHAYARISGIAAQAAVGQVDVRVMDAQGCVVRDTKQERLDRMKSFGDRCAALGGDPVLDAMVRSFNASMSDPANALVHLYEVRDAIRDRFKPQRVVDALGLAVDHWDRMQELCCSLPLQQGRHRGLFPNALRPATDGELQEARSIALNMIERYMDYLEAERCGGASPP